ncbi:MAG: DUF2817 domain-containing protein [Leptospiraceae bacterium]|nr:DUF2817 domain-containing protein [Leptospiraceae bacterium]
MKYDEYFSPDFRTARKRFRRAARDAGAKLTKLFWGLRGPLEEKLAIDIAWLGNKKARRILLHTSGIHGVEGFAGSAIQIHLLRHPVNIPPDGAMVLVHCLNPYGMAYLRRANEQNVDLNRNFIQHDHHRRGAHDGYHRLHPLLNPSSPPRFDFFTLRLLGRVIRHGFEYLKQAGAEGQFEYPSGLFFGGHEMQTGPRRFLKWARKKLKKARHICVIDVHTGVGEPGKDWLILELNHGGAYHQMLEREYPRRVDTLDPDHTIVYRVRGGLEEGIPTALHRKAHLDFVTQEFGTVSGRKLLHALRNENRAHHHGGAVDVLDPTKIALRDCFCPPDAAWRQTALTDGRVVVDLTAGYLFSD